MLGDTAEKIAKALEESLSSEIAQALNTQNMEKDFPTLAEKFWLRIFATPTRIKSKNYSLTKRQAQRINGARKRGGTRNCKAHSKHRL
jgi:hypothetical protein